MKKRIISGIMAVAMVFTLLPVTAWAAATEAVVTTLEEDLLSDRSDYIEYQQRKGYSQSVFNILGYDGPGDKTPFQTTYSNAGYQTAISVNDGGDEGDDEDSKVRVHYTGDATPVGNSLTAQNKLEIVYGGRYVKITYTVKNNGSTTQNFKIGSSADVMIGSNDYAEVKGVFSGEKCTGLSMDGSPKNDYQFQLVAPDCDTLWYGFFKYAYDYMFKDRENKKTGYKGDSGMAWSWNGTVAPGQTWSRYVLIGAGELPPAPDAPTLVGFNDPKLKAGEEATISGTVGTGENAPDTVHVSIGGCEYEAEVEDGSFSVVVTIPEEMPLGDTTLTYWGTTEEGGISEIQSAPIEIVTDPFIQLTTDSVTVMEDEVLGEDWLNSFIQSYSGEVTTSPGPISTAAPGTHTVTYMARETGLEDATATLTVTVLPKPAALSQAKHTQSSEDFTLSATMEYTGGLTYKETGFVYGALQNPTLDLKDGQVKTTTLVNTKNGQLTATVDGSQLAYGVNYYARAYAIAADGTVIYGDQSRGFGMGNPNYGTFSVTNNGTSTFTITRDGSDGEQTVYYRTVNGSAIGGTHFTHIADSVTFAEGEASKTVTVRENSVTNIYENNTATAYSNADRTYSLEIYRVTGGATIDSNWDSAQRTMTKDNNYTVSSNVYGEQERTVGTDTEIYDNNYVADHSGDGDHKIYFQNDRGKNSSHNYVNFNVQRSLDVGTAQENAYLKATASSFLYRNTFTYAEDNDCYQHIWIADHEPKAYGSPIYNGAIDLGDNTFGTAIYTARWETKKGEKGSGGISFPSKDTTGDASGVAEKPDTERVDDTWIRFGINDTAHVWFSAAGQKEDIWHVTEYKDWIKVQDTQEPQLLGVAPMADGSYLPGESVTVALVFDEIVDSGKSKLDSVTINTNWGILKYSGGGDTNVLYFTGTVQDNATGNLTVRSIDGAEYIKDMAEGGIQSTTGSVTNGNTAATMGNEGDNAPSVTVTGLTNDNGTLTATITTQNGEKLEYAWTNTAETPATGWTMVDKDTKTFTTRQTSDTWYFHVRVTNSQGVTATASKSYTFPAEEPVQLPSLTVTANNTNWAQEREIAIARSPSDATVKVKTPSGATATDVSGNTYTATENGIYTFTLESGSETITKTVTVSNIDRTAPTVNIVELTNKNHIEAVTLTVHVSDAGAGIGTVEGTWSDGNTSQATTLTNKGNGVYTATTPAQTGKWKLTVTATDNAGNQATGTSAEYTVDLSLPTVTVNQATGGNQGETYNYTVTAGNSAIVSVQLPEGFVLDETVPLPSGNGNMTGSLTFTESGTYNIIVTDAAGHVVKSADMSVKITRDLVAPDVRLSASSNGAEELTVNVSVFEEGSVSTAQVGDSFFVLSSEGDGVYTGTFTVATPGTYAVTVTDATGNQGTAEITVCSVTFDSQNGSEAATQLVCSGDKATEPNDPTKEGYTFVGWYNGEERYDFHTVVEGNISLTARWTAESAVEPTITKQPADATVDYGKPHTLSVVATAEGHILSYQWYSNTSASATGGEKILDATGSSYTIPKSTPVGDYHYYCVLTATRQDNGQTAQVTSAVATVTVRYAPLPDDTTNETIFGSDDIENSKQWSTEEGGVTLTPEEGWTVSITPDGKYTGSITFDQEGDRTETIYVKDKGGNIYEIDVSYKLDHTNPTVKVVDQPGEGDSWTDKDISIRAEISDDESGIASVTVTKPDGTTETLTGENGSYTFNATQNGEYVITATDHAGNQTAQTITIHNIDRSEPGLTVSGGDTSGSSLTVEVEAVTNGESDVIVTVQQDNKEPVEISGGEYIITEPGEYTFTATTGAGVATSIIKNVYSVTFDSDTGTAVTTQLVMEGKAVTEPESPAKDGYTFEGWYNGENKWDFGAGVNKNLTLTARWTMHDPTVELTASQTEAIYGEKIILTATATHAAGEAVDVTYAWYKNGSDTPIDGENSNTLTLTDVADSGTYTVTVTIRDDNQSKSISSTEVAVTIRKKDIFVTWLGLTQVYGETKGVQAKLSGVESGDDVSVNVNGGTQTEAGRYPLTATLTGTDDPNYTLKNHEATLVIQKKPVVITVTDNATTTGSVSLPTIQVPDDLGPDDYQVIYKDEEGNVVENPTSPGSYEVWVKFPEGSNYCHPDSSSEAQVGTFIIADAQPTLHTVTFAGGEGCTDSMESLEAVGGSIFTLPECGFEKDGFLFTGWLYDGKIYHSGDRFIMPEQAVTFTAQWQKIFKVTVTVQEEENQTPVKNAVVSLWLGANKLDEVQTDEKGQYTFSKLIPGIYNLVVTKDVRTVTSKVELTTEDKTCNAVLPKGATNSIVEVIPGSPDIVVGNLDNVFEKFDEKVYTTEDAQTVEEGGKVEFIFTAAEKQQDAADIAQDMEKITEEKGSSVTLGLVMEYTLEKEVFDAEGQKIVEDSKKITQSNVLLEILLPLPTEMQGKAGYSVYRVHDDKAEAMKANPGIGEEGFKVEGDFITIFAEKFSTYAIGYTEYSGNPGGGGTVSVYPPVVEQPEHGAVAIEPSSPQKGDQVTITTTPEDGYTVDQVIVTGSDGQAVEVTPKGDGSYTFIQPSGKVTITVTFRPMNETSDCPRDESCPMAPFTDADRSAWYHDGVHYCVEHGLMVGTSETIFEPHFATSRGMIATILWRLEGSPVVSAPMEYSDVKPGDWYEEAVRWADSVGVVTGYGDGTFGPNDPITREQMAAMLWRYAGSPAVEGSLSSFVDGAQTSDWAQAAMLWAVDQGLITGVGNDRLEPTGQATRAQAATILMRFAQDME